MNENKSVLCAGEREREKGGGRERERRQAQDESARQVVAVPQKDLLAFTFYDMPNCDARVSLCV